MVTSCKKGHDTNCPGPDTEYFKFGYTGGFAGFHKFFVIKNGALYPEDTTQPALSRAKYNTARKLITDFPAYLSAHPNQSFLCPECADQVTISITRRTNGVQESWVIDDVISTMPPEIRAYTAEAYDVISQL
jgi:hypothetical protein